MTKLEQNFYEFVLLNHE